MSSKTSTERAFGLWLAVVCAFALVLRFGYVLAFHRPATLAGDAFQFHVGANLLAEGRGFVDALAYITSGDIRQTAQHPPLFTTLLALSSLLGMRSVLAHQLWSCVMGTATVGVLGLAGRRIGGARTGLVAAALAAVYPGLWLWDGLVLSETLGMLTIALVVLCAYRFWADPSFATAVMLGLVGGLAALTRAEAALLLPATVVPLAVRARHLDGARRFALVATAGAVALATVAPWVVLNLTRFHHPPLGTSTNLDQTLVLANCDRAYHGTYLGSRAFSCLPDTLPGGDETDANEQYRAVALRYIRNHTARIPVVVLARLGRAYGVYRPLQELRLEAYGEQRELRVAEAGYAMYWFLLLAAVPGAVVLHRRRVRLWPLLAVVLTVTLAVAVTFGQTRYRTSVEIVIVLLAAVWVDDFLTRASSAAASP